MSVREMMWRSTMLGCVMLAAGDAPARALDAMDLSVSPAPAHTAHHAPSADDDGDEESFFSNGVRASEATGTVPISGRSSDTATPRFQVDVVATCRAVLADNLNYYNHNFLQGCERAVAQGGRR